MRKPLAALAALALPLAACGGSEDATAITAEAPTETGEDDESDYEERVRRTAEQGRGDTVGEPPRQAMQALTVSAARDPDAGEYLVDGNGRPLYLFTADTPAQNGGAPEIACAGGCLERWPLASTNGEPEAVGGARADLLGVARHEGIDVVTYDGWPLYYFAQDTGARPSGNEISSFGGVWFLVTPDGGKAGEGGGGDPVGERQ